MIRTQRNDFFRPFVFVIFLSSFFYTLLSQISSHLRITEEEERGRKKMTVGMINANPVVHERPERSAHPHAADALDALDVFGTVLRVPLPFHSSPCRSVVSFAGWN
jgi:hypothetical protein